MAELFKNIYNLSFFNKIIPYVKKVVPYFEAEEFIRKIVDKDWEKKELKQRMRHITEVLHSCLKGTFSDQAAVITDVIDMLEKEGIREESIEFMFFPDFIEMYGISQYEISIKAIERITQFTSCEFAIRPFIIKYPEKTISQMLLWSTHTHPMVRRLATEGCRPRLPWAMALPELKKNPAPILAILEQLKTDESASVRRSVANNLNDISKDNPEIVIDLVQKWKGISKEVDWVVKHASRTLLKAGNTKVLQLFGFGAVDMITISDFTIHTPTVIIGDALRFSFLVKNTSSHAIKIRVEYGLYYMKANGQLAKKVFKISEKSYAGNSVTPISRKQSFKIITTRKFYVGKHKISLILNGKEQEAHGFLLVK
ncbi:DNA alkylation repair protein [Aquimarina sp. TRL1]|uniref:DNA alkylation repair protein n=1 Tax=Aquimarina sp. (strain TRL1) TaxID=2736252 RepID=UPI00158C0FBB|nr:DNA alkylation repair protein [Aquimarina sp. TRL1]QKX04840.1 DNA alkylation repair protein [Aquimarina sp. TRL1]